MATRPSPRPSSAPSRGSRTDRPTSAQGERESHSRTTVLLLAALPLLAAALAGSVDRPGQGGLLLVFGLALLWRPPTIGSGNVLGRGPTVVAAALVGLATLPLLLPARWFPGASWRTVLTDDLLVSLPATLSPQPWLTAEGVVLLLAGLAWLWWASDAAGVLSDRRRRAAARWFVFGAAVLALVAVVCQRLGVQPPGWRQERGLGPFPNRNQFGNFLALAALLALGCAHGSWRAGRRGRAAALGVALAVLAYAVFVNYSRAGVVLLFGGAAVYTLLAALGRGRHGHGHGHGEQRHHRSRRGTTARRLAVAVSVLTLLLAGFLLVGGDTLGRFTNAGGAWGAAGAVRDDFRWKIQADALDMLRAMPPCGPGLGNFSALFPFFRVRTATAVARAVHPESDWFWLGTEMGWPALVLAAFGVVLLARRLWWRRQGGATRGTHGAGTTAEPNVSSSPLRRATLVGLGAFFLHSFAEVSTHRLGTLFPAVLLYGLALPSSSPPSSVSPTTAGTAVSRRHRWLFRLLGAGLATVGVLWLRAAYTAGADWPLGKLAAENLRRAGNVALRAGDPAGAAEQLSRALGFMPLDWGTRYDRGLALLNAGQPDAALAEFRRARELEPLAPSLSASEAVAWLAEGRHPDAALAAVEETFRRDPVAGERLFRETLSSRHGAADPGLRPGLETLARRVPTLELAYLEEAPPAEVWPWLEDVVAADPELTRFAADSTRLRRFLRLWARRGDPAEMAAAMNRHPTWQSVGWREWAEALVLEDKPLEACRLANRFAPQPTLPTVLTTSPAPPGDPDALARHFERVPGDFALGLRLFRAQRAAGRTDDALATLTTLSKPANAPAYLGFLEAQLRAQTGDGVGAWQAWERYLQGSGQN